MTQPDADDEIKRLRLRLNLMFCLCLIILSLSIYLAFRSFATGKVIEAEGIILKDSAGNQRARLTLRASTTCLEIVGPLNDATAEICADDKNGSSLLLTDKVGRSRAFLSAGQELSEVGARLAPGLVIAADDGKNLYSVQVGNETQFLIGRGDERNSLVYRSDGKNANSLTITDAAGKPKTTLP